MKGFDRFSFFHRNPRNTFVNSEKKMGEMIESNLSSWKIDRLGRQTRDIIFDRTGPDREPSNVASNRHARRIAAIALRRRIRELIRTNPKIRMRFLTLFSDDFNANDHDTVVPLETIKRSIGQLLWKSGLAGWVGAIEIQATTKHRAGIGRDLWGNVHLLIWTHDPLFNFDALEAVLQASPRLRCELGAETALFTAEEFDQADTKVRLRIAETKLWYMFKLPSDGKNVVPRGTKPSVIRGCKLEANVAVRLAEILSRMRMDELIMGSGEGRAIADGVRAAIRENSLQLKWQDLDSDIEQFWTFARRRNKKAAYRPVLVQRWMAGKGRAAYKRGPYKKGGDSRR